MLVHLLRMLRGNYSGLLCLKPFYVLHIPVKTHWTCPRECGSLAHGTAIQYGTFAYLNTQLCSASLTLRELTLLLPFHACIPDCSAHGLPASCPCPFQSHQYIEDLGWLQQEATMETSQNNNFMQRTRETGGLPD